MDYYIKRDNGVVEIFSTSKSTLPEGAIELTAGEADRLRSGESILMNGSVVANEAYQQ